MNESEMRRLLESLVEHVVCYDREMNVRWANRIACDSAGRSPEEIIGRKCHEIWADSSTPCSDCPVFRAMDTGQMEEAERTTQDGRVWFIRGYPLRDEQGNITGGVGLTQDITERKRTEQTVREERDLLRALIDNVPDLVYAKDRQSRFLVCNAGILSRTGAASADEVVGKTDFDFYPQELAEQFYSEEQELMRTGRAVLNREMCFKDRATGAPIWSLLSKIPLHNGDGQVVGLVGLGRDITERRRAQEAYQAVVDHSLQGLVIIQDVRVVFANQAMAEMSGYSVEEMLALTPQQLREFIHPDDRELIWGYHEARLEGQSPPQRYKFRALRKEGATRWLEISTSRIEYQGRPAIQAAYVDVTEQMEAEEALRQSEARNRALVDAMPDLMFRLDASGTFLDYSIDDRAHPFADPEESLGRTIREILPAAVADTAMAALETALREGTSQMVEYQLDVPAEGLRDFECRLTGCGDGEVLAIVRDITERKRADSLSRLTLDLAVRLNSVNTLREGAQLCLEAAIEASQMECGGVYVVNETATGLDLLVYSGVSAEYAHSVSHCGARSPQMRVMSEKHPFYLNQAFAEHPLSPVQRREGLRATAALPILDGDDLVGFLAVAARRLDEVPHWSRVALETIAAQIGGTMSRLRTQEALQAAEREKATILDAMSEVVTYQDASLRVVWANHAAREVLGKSEDEIVGRSCHDLWYGRHQPCSDCPVQAAMESQETVECDRSDADGTIWHLRAEPVKDGTGNVVGVVELALDVTERKLADARLRELQDVINRSPVMVLVWRVVPGQWPIELVSANVERVLGYTADELVSGRVGWPDITHPEDVPRVEAEVAQYLEQGRREWSQEYRLVTKSGEVRWFEDQNLALRDEDGQVSRIQSIVIDVTERTQAERQLRESESRLRATIESLPFDFFLIGRDGRYAMENAVCRQHWGSLAGKRPADICPDERTLALWQDNNRRAFAGEVVTGDVILAPHGEPGHYHNIISPIREGDEIRGILGLNIDITERKGAEDALRYRMEFEELVADISNLFVNLWVEEIETGMDRALEKVGRFVEADRSFVHMLSDDRTHMSMTNEWCAEGIDSNWDRMQGVALEDLPWGLEQLTDVGLLNISSVADLKGEEAEAKDLLQSAGVQSLLGVPIVISGRLIGFLGFSAVRRQHAWSQDEISLLKITAEMFANALERRQSAEALNNRLAFETLLSHLSAEFVSLPVEGIDAQIEGWLGRISEFLQIDRATIIQTAGRDEDVKATHRWAADGLRRAPAVLSKDTFAWFVEQLGKPEVLVLSRLEDAPEEADKAKRYAREQGMKSVVVVPVTMGGSALGAVVFSSMRQQRNWSDEVVQRLRLVGEVFANALMRRRAIEALQREHDVVLRMAETSPVGILLLNRSGKIMFANACAEQVLGLTKDEITGRTYNAPEWAISDYEGGPFPDDQLPFTRVVRTKASVHDVRHAIQTPDGRRVLLRINGTPILDDSGQVDGVVVAVEDVTERVKAEETLRESEQRFRELAELLPQTVFEMDLEGNFTYVNRAGLEAFGYSPGDVGRVKMEQVFVPEDRERARRNIRRRFAGEEFSACEYRALCKDGSSFPVSLYSAPIVRGGRVWGLRGIVVDMTERKRAEDALRDSERKYRELYEGSRDASAAVDMQGKILDCNSVFLDMLGYTKDEIRALTYEDITPSQWHGLEKHILDSQVLVRGYSDVYEKEYIRKDGTTIPIELRTYLHRDRAGRPAGMWALVRDISERKKAEMALRASERNYREILNAANEAVFVHDPDTGAILDVNATTIRMTGYSREELLRRDVGDISSREPGYSQQEAVARIMKAARRRPQLFEWHMRRKDGTLFWAEVNLKSAIIGGHRRVLAVVRDVTDRKRAEEAAQQHLAELTRAWHANTLGEMASGLAHELNQPLCAILNYSNSCLRMTRRPQFAVEVVSSSLEQIVGQAERAADIIKHIRSLVAKREPQRTDLDLNEVVSDALNMVRSEAAKRNAVIISHLAPDLPAVAANAVELEQVVLNLLRNALEAVNDANVTERTLRVSTSVRQDRQLQVVVSDTGPGFSPEVSEKIFDSFFTTKQQGLGVGLSLSRRIVASYGGRLWAESDGVSGATFIFTLPLEGADRGR